MKGYWRAIGIGTVFCLFFNYVSVVSLNRTSLILPSTQVSSLSFGFLILLVVAINPLLRMFRRRPLAGRELAIVATMSIAAAGVATFGFTSVYVPTAANLMHPQYRAKYEKHVIPNVNKAFYVESENPTDYDAYKEGMRVRDRHAYPIFLPQPDRLTAFPRDVGRYFLRGNPDGRHFWGDLPWRAWMAPLFAWGSFFALLIAFFYALNELLYKHWRDNEKLVFPHAELLHTLIGGTKGEGRIPAAYVSRAFWIGFAVSAGVSFYNGATTVGWLPGLQPIPLSGDLGQYAVGTWLEPVSTFHLNIFFATIGLAFLLPAEISFSIVFFYLFIQIQQLMAVHSGHLPSMAAAGANWFDRTNFVRAQGGGGVVVFCSICLWKVRHRFLCWIYRFTSPGGKGRLSAEEIREHSAASFLFFMTSLAIIGMFMWGGSSAFLSVFFYIAILLMTVLALRVISEAGLIGFQFQVGPLHFLRNFGIFRFKTLANIKSLAAIYPIYSVFFLDPKTFMAPAMMTVKALSDRLNAGRRPFAVAIAISFGVAFCTSVLVSLALVYDLGLPNMYSWFYRSFPTGVYDGVNHVADGMKHYTSMDLPQTAWTFVGGATMTALLFARRLFFWVPHPLGMMLMMSPVTETHWFSFLLAWMFKSLAVRYSKPDTYRNLKLGFMGLFVGELVAVAIAALVAISGLGNMGLTLNR